MVAVAVLAVSTVRLLLPGDYRCGLAGDAKKDFLCRRRRLPVCVVFPIFFISLETQISFSTTSLADYSRDRNRNKLAVKWADLMLPPPTNNFIINQFGSSVKKTGDLIGHKTLSSTGVVWHSFPSFSLNIHGD